MTSARSCATATKWVDHMHQRMRPASALLSHSQAHVHQPVAFSASRCLTPALGSLTDRQLDELTTTWFAMILSNEPCEQGALGNPVRFVMFLLSLSLSLSEVGRGQGECWSEREPVSRSKACLVIINSLACRLLISAVQIVCRCLVYWLLIGIFCCQYCNSKNTFRHRGSLKPNLAIYPYSLFSVSTVLLRGFFFFFDDSIFTPCNWMRIRGSGQIFSAFTVTCM